MTRFATKLPPLPTIFRSVRRNARRWIAVAGGVLVIMLVVFLLLPVWLSNEQGRTFVLQRFNRDLPGTLDIKRWSVSWWHGVEIEDLSLTLPDGRQVVTCSHIQTELTLWSLLRGSYDVGNTNIPGAKIRITKYADGMTDIGRLFPAVTGKGPNPLRSLRGAIQVTGGELTLVSERAGGQAVTISNLTAELSIASPVTPYNFRLRGLAGGPAGRAISCDALMPPISNWPPPVWDVLPGLDISASGISTAVAADWLDLGLGWDEALGLQIESLRLQNAGVLQDSSSWIAALQVRGAGTGVDAKILVQRGGDVNGRRLAMPESLKLNPRDPTGASVVKDFHCEAYLRVSQPVRELLQRINPALAGLRRTDDVITMKLQSLDLTTRPMGGDFTGTVTIPAGEMADAGLLHEVLWSEGRPVGSTAGQTTIPATFGPLVVRLSGQTMTCDRFTMTVKPPGGGLDKLTFSGTADLDGKLAMQVTRVQTLGGAGLGTSTVELPIAGTTAAPRVILP